MNWRRIWNDPVWSKVIAGAILGVGSVAWAIIPQSVIARLTVVLLVLAGGLLLAWQFLRPKITWNFENFLGMVGGGGQLLINSFQASGNNRARTGIYSVSGHLVSNIDNTKSGSLRFVIGGQPVPPDETTGIPPRASFQIMIPFTEGGTSTEPRLSEYDFLRRWSSFRFVAQLDETRYERNFSQKRVTALIEMFKRVANPLPKPEVRHKT